jgi:predicted RNase H-like nuclease (RuvC/YqgF family)
MSTSPEIDPLSTEHLLNCLGLAIDEAKYVKQIISCRELAEKLKREAPFSDQLIQLNKEIRHLEKKLAEVRSQAKKSS